MADSRSAKQPATGKGSKKSPTPANKKKARSRKKQPKGLAVFTEGGNVPRWVTLARLVLVLAFAATIPTILGIESGRRLLWAAAIAALPLFWVIGGYHLWRRLCPLAVLAQIGRLFGHPGKKRVNAKSWLAKNYMILQLVMMLVALSLRLIMTNGTPLALAIFLGSATAIAIGVGFVFTGKTWCNYVCPVGMVEKFYTEPARLQGLSNSQCSPCTACKKNCPDIDLEQGYWKELMLPSRRIAYYAWPGIVLAFYVYYYFVAGDWNYYFSGAWTLEDTQISEWLSPGFFFLEAVPIVVAAPLTLLVFGAVSSGLFRVIESAALSSTEKLEADVQRVRHRVLAVAGFTAFIIFYYFGGQPTIRMLPGWFGSGLSTVVAVAATAILVRRWRRSESDFVQEKFAEKILKRWEWGDEPESDSLHDIYLLHHERKKEADARLGAYKETVREMVADGLVTRNELALLDSLRAQLGVGDKEHQRVLDELGDEERQLFDPDFQGSVEQRLQMEQYRRELQTLLLSAARAGASPDDSDIESVRQEYGIDRDDHKRTLAELRGDSGPLIEVCRAELGEVKTLADAIAHASATPDAQGSRSVTLLADLCRDRARDRLRRAINVLTSEHPALEPTILAKQLVSANPSDRQLAREALEGELARMHTEIIAAADQLWAPSVSEASSAPLIALTSDPSPHIRAIAAHVLSRFDDDDAREAAAQALGDDDGLVREAAAYALGVRGRLRRDLMAKALKDPDQRVRRAAVAAMSPTERDPKLAVARAAVVQTAGAFATFNANARIESLTTLEKMALLKRVPLFANLDPEDLEQASLLAEERDFEPGQSLCEEGETGEEVFVIISGGVEVWTGSGKDKRVLGRPGPGTCIGEMAVVDSSPRSATVVAIESSRTLVLPAEEFRHLIYSRPAVGQAVIDVLVARLRRAIASQ